MKKHTYICIDLKSFYASTECRERGLDPLDTNLLVADESRTDKTICLAVSLCVFAVTCILKDAYLSLREKPRTVMTMFALLTLINLGFGGMYAYSGDLIEDGVLTFRAVNPIIGFATLVILIVYIVNHLLRSREEEAE